MNPVALFLHIPTAKTRLPREIARYDAYFASARIETGEPTVHI
jgi:hypothetical protein